MLRPVAMAYLRVQVSARDAAAVTRCIAREGLLHLVDLAHGRVAPTPADARLPELAGRYDELERRVRAVAARLELPLPPLTGRLVEEGTDARAELDALEARFLPIEQATAQTLEAAAEAADVATRAQRTLEDAQAAHGAGVDGSRLVPLQYAVVRVVRATQDQAERLGGLLTPGPFAIVPLDAGRTPALLAVVTNASSAERLDQALAAVECERLLLPAGPGGWDLGRLEQRATEARKALEERRSKVAALKAEHGRAVAELLERVQVRRTLLEAQAHFAAAGRFVFINGWVPAVDAERLRAAILRAANGLAVVEIQRADQAQAAGDRRVPILHHNPLLLRPFERLVRTYGTPAYEEVEPTAFFAISFLAMFGLMFGDVGHGAVLFSAGWLLFRRLPRFLDYGILLMEAGVVSMLFGALYGSVFGFERLIPALWMRPMENLDHFMVVATILGIVLLTLGTALSVVNAWRAGNRIQALFGLKGVFGGVLYWTVLVLVARQFLPRHFGSPVLLGVLAGGAAVLLLARPIVVRLIRRRTPTPERIHARAPRWLWFLEGSIELVDTLVAFFTNTLSFVRIAAFAAVHAGICVALFAIVDMVQDVRFGGLWSLLTLLVGNAVILLLEGLVVTVQALRLEYYEFFSRFFRGGGEPYRPLSLAEARDTKGARDASSAQPAAPAGPGAGAGGGARAAGGVR